QYEEEKDEGLPYSHVLALACIIINQPLALFGVPLKHTFRVRVTREANVVPTSSQTRMKKKLYANFLTPNHVL
ncbi:MAG TPA: hypothetical protein D7I00_01460, partial [Candidatus Poseidoniales archaeon]